ncbi:Hypothetical predicted protein, partial [Pelobates cultripes]
GAGFDFARKHTKTCGKYSHKSSAPSWDVNKIQQLYPMQRHATEALPPTST